MKRSLFFIFILMVVASCSVDPVTVHYGYDHCSWCEMIIMDNRYGTEIVNSKGKAYKFDSVECLVEFLEDPKQNNTRNKLLLVTPFDKPETLVDAQKSYYLQSKALPSPMGMFLSAFESEATALAFVEEYGGTLYTWEELLENFKSLK